MFLCHCHCMLSLCVTYITHVYKLCVNYTLALLVCLFYSKQQLHWWPGPVCARPLAHLKWVIYNGQKLIFVHFWSLKSSRSRCWHLGRAFSLHCHMEEVGTSKSKRGPNLPFYGDIYTIHDSETLMAQSYLTGPQ